MKNSIKSRLRERNAMSPYEKSPSCKKCLLTPMYIKKTTQIYTNLLIVISSGEEVVEERGEECEWRFSKIISYIVWSFYNMDALVYYLVNFKNANNSQRIFKSRSHFVDNIFRLYRSSYLCLCLLLWIVGPSIGCLAFVYILRFYI